MFALHFEEFRTPHARAPDAIANNVTFLNTCIFGDLLMCTDANTNIHANARADVHFDITYLVRLYNRNQIARISAVYIQYNGGKP